MYETVVCSLVTTKEPVAVLGAFTRSPAKLAPSEYVPAASFGVIEHEAVPVASVLDASPSGGAAVASTDDASDASSTVTPGNSGFSPDLTPRLIATYPTRGAALALSKGTDRDRAVDESGNQVSIFNRIGARPMTLLEMQRLYLRDGKVYTVP